MVPNVLLVEDSAADLELIKQTVESTLGSSVSLCFADSLAGACAQLAERTVDVAVVDLALPDAVGAQVVSELKHLKPNLPVVVVSGDDTDAAQMRSLAGGAMHYVPKSQLSALPSAVIAALDFSRRTEGLASQFEDRINVIYLNSTKTIQRVDSIWSTLHGDGSEQNPGLVTDVKENTRFRRAGMRVFWLVVGATVATVVGAVAVALTSR